MLPRTATVFWIINFVIFTNSIVKSIYCSNNSLIDLYHLPLEFIATALVPGPSFNFIFPEIFNFNSCNFNDLLAFLSYLDNMGNITT